jgi:hypothetical protein
MSSNVVRLTYASTATFQSDRSGGIEVEVARILAASRRNNKAKHIGGVLHYGEGYFFQALEGERDSVNELYTRIGEDPRHRDVKVLTFEDVDKRYFADWSMKYVPLEDQIQRMLDRHGIEFNPYRFDKAIVDDFLKLCVEGEDPTAELEAQAAKDAESGKDSRPWWKRLIGG